MFFDFITKCTDIFDEKNEESFCNAMQKLLTFFSTKKHIEYFFFVVEKM